MSDLRDEISAYERIRTDLELTRIGEWAVVHGGQLVDTFQEFQDAADEAVRRFGRGPYLIRQIGAPQITLSASLMYNLADA